MPLPADFSPWEHLREQITVAHNINVQRSFFGVQVADIGTELGAMRTAVFIEDDDTVDMIVLRLLLFYFVFQGEMQNAYYTLSLFCHSKQKKIGNPLLKRAVEQC